MILEFEQRSSHLSDTCPIPRLHDSDHASDRVPIVQSIRLTAAGRVSVGICNNIFEFFQCLFFFTKLTIMSGIKPEGIIEEVRKYPVL